MLRLIILATLLFSVGALARTKHYYKMNHETCRIKVHQIAAEKSSADFLEESMKLLANLGYHASQLKKGAGIIPGDLHIALEYSIVGKQLYKECIVKTKIYQAKLNRARVSSDEVLFEKMSKRSLPRLTLRGFERCKRALRDVFALTPYCVKMKR